MELMTLFALTLKHPWSFAIAHLGKNIENRTWKPPGHLIGQTIAIHGGAVPRGAAAEDCYYDAQVIAKNILTLDYQRGLSQVKRKWLYDNGRALRGWVAPGIVATARLADVVTESDSPWFVGPYGWVLEDVKPVDPPVPHRGAQGLWKVDPKAIEQLVERGFLT